MGIETMPGGGIVKDFEGFALSGDIDSKTMVVYTIEEQAERIAKVTNKGKAVPVIVTDNSYLTRLRIMKEILQGCPFQDSVIHWIETERGEDWNQAILRASEESLR